MNVSVVMPVYNGEDYLEDSIKSILNQTYHNFEFIIVNDGSTDRTASILEQICDSRVKVVHLKKNSGVSQARNIGIAKANGDWIVLQDHDDISLPNRIEEQLKYIQEHPWVIQVGTMIEGIPGKTSVSFGKLQDEANYINQTIRWEQIKQKRFFSSPICFGTSMFLKKVFEEAGGYHSDYQIGEDYDLFMRMIEYGPVEVVPKKLYQYRVDLKSYSRRDAMTTYNSFHRILVKYICKRFVHRQIRRPRFLLFASEKGCTNFQTHIAPFIEMDVVEYVTRIEGENIETHLQAYDQKDIHGIIMHSHAYLKSVEDAIYHHFTQKGFRPNEQWFYVDGWIFATPARTEQLFTNRLTVEEVKATILDMLDTHHLECKVAASDRLKKAMEYNPLNEQIKFNRRYIVEYAEYFKVPLESTIRIMAYHEFGHYLDFKIHPEKLKKLCSINWKVNSKEEWVDLTNLIIRNEYLAWKFGKSMVPADLMHWYEELNERNILNYKNMFEKYLKKLMF